MIVAVNVGNPTDVGNPTGVGNPTDVVGTSYAGRQSWTPGGQNHMAYVKPGGWLRLAGGFVSLSVATFACSTQSNASVVTRTAVTDVPFTATWCASGGRRATCVAVTTPTASGSCTTVSDHSRVLQSHLYDCVI